MLRCLVRLMARMEEKSRGKVGSRAVVSGGCGSPAALLPGEGVCLRQNPGKRRNADRYLPATVSVDVLPTPQVATKILTQRNASGETAVVAPTVLLL